MTEGVILLAEAPLVLHCLFYSTYKQLQGSALLKLSPIIIIALFK